MKSFNGSRLESLEERGEELPEGVLTSKDGRPLLLHRGSSLPASLSKEEKYKPEHLGHSTGAPSAGEAFFFAEKRKTAALYARGKHANREQAIKQGGDPHVDSVYLVMRNPLVHDFKGKVYRDDTYFNLLRKAKEGGYDGVIFKNSFDGRARSRIEAVLDGEFFGETIYGVFSPDQILVQDTQSLVSPKRKAEILETERKRREARKKERRMRRAA